MKPLAVSSSHQDAGGTSTWSHGLFRNPFAQTCYNLGFRDLLQWSRRPRDCLAWLVDVMPVGFRRASQGVFLRFHRASQLPWLSLRFANLMASWSC
jgi:hypothetical protein